VLREANDSQELIGRVAALDIGKKELVCCVRVPGKAGKRLQEVQTYTTMTRSLLVLADRLAELGVTRVVMEATSDYWKAPVYLLEAQGLEVWLVNAKDVKHLPGRPKTDRLDAVWLAKLAERQMLRPSFVPPPAIRRLRDLTRYRAGLVAVRTAEKQRVEQAAGGRPDQAERGRLRHLRGLRPGHAGRPGRRRAGPAGAGRAGPGQHARQAPPAAGGVHRPLQRPSRVPAGHDAWAHRPDQRRHRPAGPQDRGRDRPCSGGGRPAG
jgi:transposase